MTDAGDYDLGEPTTERKPSGGWMVCIPMLTMVAVFAAVMWHRTATYDELAAEAAALKAEAAQLEDARKGFAGRPEPDTHAEREVMLRRCETFYDQLPHYRERLETFKRRVRRHGYDKAGPTGQPPIDLDAFPAFDDDP